MAAIQIPELPAFQQTTPWEASRRSRRLHKLRALRKTKWSLRMLRALMRVTAAHGHRFRMRVNQQMRQWMIKILLWLRPRVQSVYTYFGLAGVLSDAPAAVQTQASGVGVPGAHQSPPSLKNKMQLPGAHMWIFAALLIAAAAHAQQGGQTSNVPPLTGSVAPTGNCGAGSLYVNTTTGDLYDCNAGSWLKVNGAGGSGAFSGGLGASFQDATEISAPANPAAGNNRLYLSSATHLLACLTSSGANCMPAGGAGTVTQVTSGNFSPLFNVSVATNTSTPAFSFAGISQSQNLFFASPNGSSGVGAFRAIAAADVPASANSCAAHQFTISLASGLNVTCAQPVAADIGSIPGSSGQLLFNNAGAIGAEDPVISYSTPVESTAAWTSATGGNTAVSVNLYTSASSSSLSTVVVTLNQGSTISGGAVTFEVSDTTAFTNAYNASCWQAGTGSIVSTYTLVASTNQAFVCNAASYQAFRVRLSTTITGSATVNVGVQPSAGPAQPSVVTTPATGSTQTVSGTVTTTPPANASTNVTQFGGTNVSTGTGAGGAGIPRVTISNDSSLAANQSVNESQINGVTPLMGNGTTRHGIASRNRIERQHGGSCLGPGGDRIGSADGRAVSSWERHREFNRLPELRQRDLLRRQHQRSHAARGANEQPKDLRVRLPDFYFADHGGTRCARIRHRQQLRHFAGKDHAELSAPSRDFDRADRHGRDDAWIYRIADPREQRALYRNGRGSERSGARMVDEVLMRRFSPILGLLLWLLCAAPAHAAIANLQDRALPRRTSCTLSATATGAVNIFAAYRSSSATAPSLPAGYTNIGTFSQSTTSFRLYCKVATSSGDTGSGTATNATHVAGVSYSGSVVDTLGVASTDCGVTGVSIIIKSGATSTTVTYGALTVENSNNWIVAFMGSAAGSTCIPASGLTSRASNADILVADSNGTVSSWASHTCTVTSGIWISLVAQIRGADPTPNTASSPVLYRSWGFTGLSSNNAGNTVKPFFLNLENSGPRQLASGHLLMIYLKYPLANTVTVADNKSGGTNTYTKFLTCTDANWNYDLWETLASGTATQVTVTPNVTIADFQAAYRIYYNVPSSSPLMGPGSA